MMKYISIDEMKEFWKKSVNATFNSHISHKRAIVQRTIEEDAQLCQHLPLSLSEKNIM